MLLNVGNVLVGALPFVIKFLSIVGTFALLLVAGGIFTHSIPFLHNFLTQFPSMLKEFIFSLIVGLIMVGILEILKPVLSLAK